MAKHKQQDLFDVLRASGLRKKVAHALSRSAGKAGAKRSKALSASAKNLRSVASSIDKRAVDPKRSAAAKKAAQTRKRNAAKRSAAAKQGARTRAKAK
jgi:DNA topoisomerase I